ncbi:MAG TPA: DUF2721 domain-containing protein [Anaeromyxobacteraceae bacterium]|jgi:hypothetical protein|nr:DUF2721 domain-containing protein [Anaeromyxobacteraceae bacterium]
MTGDSLQRIAAAVTPAVMVSACGLIALGLDNQASRTSLRLRELAAEHRREEGQAARRPLLREQVAILGRRHAIIARAQLLDYGALFAFVVTSLLSLAQGLLPIPPEVPFLAFLAGVAMLGTMAIFAIASVHLSGAALRLEQREILERGGDRGAGGSLRRPITTGP